jgi:hypothetical protein
MELLRAKINNIVQKRQDMLSKTPAELRADKLKELENNLNKARSRAKKVTNINFIVKYRLVLFHTK